MLELAQKLYEILILVGMKYFKSRKNKLQQTSEFEPFRIL